MHQNLFYATEEEARSCPRGQINLQQCSSCSLVFNSAFDEKLLEYGGAYDSSRSHSPTVLKHTDLLIERLRRGRQGQVLVEVGCGEGYFLKQLCSEAEAYGEGYDPAATVYYGSLVDIHDHKLQNGRGDLLIGRHILEHMKEPSSFLKGLGSFKEGYFEVPSLEWILQEGSFWDIFYEHTNYFSKASLQSCLAQSGFSCSIESSFGAQYLSAFPSQRLETSEPLGLEWEKLKKKEGDMSERIRGLMQKGRLAVWGAAAKGATLTAVSDPDAYFIDALVDINSKKQGGFLAGTGHPILAPEHIAERHVEQVLLMNPLYLEEVRGRLASMSLNHSVEVHLI